MKKNLGCLPKMKLVFCPVITKVFKFDRALAIRKDDHMGRAPIFTKLDKDMRKRVDGYSL